MASWLGYLPLVSAVRALDRVLTGFSRTNANNFVDRRDEDLAVADLSGTRSLGDHVDHLLNVVVRHDDLDLHLRHEIDDVGRAAVDFFLTAGPSEAFDLGDRHAM